MREAVSLHKYIWATKLFVCGRVKIWLSNWTNYWVKVCGRLLNMEALPLVQEGPGLRMLEAEGGLHVAAWGPLCLAFLGLAGLLGLNGFPDSKTKDICWNGPDHNFLRPASSPCLPQPKVKWLLVCSSSPKGWQVPHGPHSSCPGVDTAESHSVTQNIA